MPEVHVPHLDEHDEAPPSPVAPVGRPKHGRSFATIALEIVLISAGVFLGLAGEQWRENAHRRERAEESLRRLRSEVTTNRTAVEAVREYHADRLKAIQTFFAADAKARSSINMSLDGVRPVGFEHTAWDLALATQSLADIDSELAFALARIYNRQQGYTELSHGMLQAMYLRPLGEDLAPFLRTVEVFYDDIVIYEPGLVKMYDDILPQIDHALGE